MTRILSIAFFLLCANTTSSWIVGLPPTRRSTQLDSSPSESLQQEGNELIKEALLQKGCREDQFSIEWKADRIVVTVLASTFLNDEDATDNDSPDDDAIDNVAPSDEDDEDFLQNDDKSAEGFNLVELSRAIQGALDMNDEGSIGWKIGMNYEFEVTTPGASNELSGIMFESYKGFDVMVDFVDPKKKKNKTIDGRLVERNDEFTIINIKGRMKKIKNDIVRSVKLPKAKKEKGAR